MRNSFTPSTSATRTDATNRADSQRYTCCAGEKLICAALSLELGIMRATVPRIWSLRRSRSSDPVVATADRDRRVIEPGKLAMPERHKGGDHARLERAIPY